ncbi:MAG: hypothetical protein Q9217_001740 [Psora testacea]
MQETMMTERKMQLVDWLDDLCVRFIINLPTEELSVAERICFQIEEAQWFYEDFIRPLDPELPSLNLKSFCAVMFQHCPLLWDWSSQKQAEAFQAFLVYKTMVPVRGAIMLNENMDEVVLVKGWKKGANWSFPRGKRNKDELDMTCAVREVYEETGYDLKEAGLVDEKGDVKYIDVEIRGQDIRLYVFRSVPMDTHFEPRTRKEISKISWHKLSDLPTVKKRKQQQEDYGEGLAVHANKFYMVAPFLGPLKKWISQQRKHDRAMHASEAKVTANTNMASIENAAMEQEALGEQMNDERAEDGHLARLLHTLQQSSQARTSDLPEVSRPIAPQQASEVANLPTSADLLALLRNGSDAASETKPATPFNQVVEQPLTPRSPPHHLPSQRAPNLPPPPNFPFPATHVHRIGEQNAGRRRSGVFTPPEDAPPQMPQVRPIPAPAQPAQLAPRSSATHTSLPPVSRAPAPYQRPGSQFSLNPYPPLGPQQPSVPPASKLPQPKLTAQASGLLDLFKSGGPSAKPLAATSSTQKPAAPPTLLRDEPNSKSPFSFVPPQVSQTSSGKVPQSATLPNKHQANLLELFRTSSVSHPESKGLQPPATAIELSASPSPGHSRESSKAADASAQAALHKAESPGKHVEIQKPHQPLNGRVSATVSGPLNIPQFDMIRSTHRETPGSLQKILNKPIKNSPIPILSRPSSSHGQPFEPAEGLNTQPPLQPSHQKPQPASLITPTKPLHPPTPSLKARAAPLKPFQPQILRRPGLSQDESEPSPIQPLPSPQHNISVSKRQIHTTDQKKSLLSLFTKPSPTISSPSAIPSGTLHPASLISPLENPTITLPQQAPIDAHDVLVPTQIAPTLKAAVSMRGNPPKQAKAFTAPDRMPPPLDTKTTTTTAADGQKSGQSSSNPVPTPTHSSTTTPIQKEFLLGYLADVVKSGR